MFAKCNFEKHEKSNMKITPFNRHLKTQKSLTQTTNACILQIFKFHYHFTTSCQWTHSILCHLNPAYIFTCYQFNIHFHNILQPIQIPTLIISGEEYKLPCSTLWNFLYSSTTSSLLDPNIPSSILFSNTPNGLYLR